jgi:hypothetical protein
MMAKDILIVKGRQKLVEAKLDGSAIESHPVLMIADRYDI